jgi:NTP pyrophosphatase (non-canonical NTP hydrolase)
MATAGDLTPTRTGEELLAHAGLFTAAFGLAGEGGEMSDHVKKWLAQGHDLDLEFLDKEAGDVLWYLARYAEWRKKSLTELARKNISKLASRYPEGFSSDKSLNR